MQKTSIYDISDFIIPLFIFFGILFLICLENFESIKGTLMQILKSTYMFVFI